MIFDLDINEPDQQKLDKQPKNLYSYIKSQKKENTSIAPLRSEGVLHNFNIFYRCHAVVLFMFHK
jgi:hypothetical protein